jgi:hypothetical protein
MTNNIFGRTWWFPLQFEPLGDPLVIAVATALGVLYRIHPVQNAGKNASPSWGTVSQNSPSFTLIHAFGFFDFCTRPGGLTPAATA